jgi:hypothetical protein
MAFGNCCQEILNKTIKMYGSKSSGSFQHVSNVQSRKTQQKNVNKQWLGTSNFLGELLYINISSIKEEGSVEQSLGFDS